jgi:hypothetical protein
VNDAATVADRFVEMLKAGELERISQDLARKIRGAAGHADDAVCAVTKILALANPPAPEKVGSYLYRTALNEMADEARRGEAVRRSARLAIRRD